MKSEFKVLGIDVSKSSVTCHILSQYPAGGLALYWKKSRNQQSKNYPSFYSNPKAKSSQKSIFDFVDYVQLEAPDIAILEPTGNHYSRLWAKILENLGIKIYWVGHVELRRYRGGKNLPNKSDAADALAMAAYGQDLENRTENGELRPEAFLRHRPEIINQSARISPAVRTPQPSTVTNHQPRPPTDGMAVPRKSGDKINHKKNWKCSTTLGMVSRTARRGK